MIPAIILSAGKSSRMGRTKAIMPLNDGHTFVSRIVTTFREADVDDIVIVVGHDSDAVTNAVETAGLSARVVLNRAYESGQLSSILAGLSVADRPGVQGVLLTLVDVPLVLSSTVKAVVERYRSARPAVVRPVSGIRHGHPILLDRTLFEQIRAADPAVGIKPIVRAFASPAGDVPVNDEGAFVDIDTPDEYERVTQWGLDC
jgi:molybdenum cofactor cytidylyltransferase